MWDLRFLFLEAPWLRAGYGFCCEVSQGYDLGGFARLGEVPLDVQVGTV